MPFFIVSNPILTIGGSMRKAIIAFIFIISAFSAWVYTIPGADARNVSLVVDADSGRVLKADHANALWYPASLTKMMTVYVTLSAIEAGKLSFDTEITVSNYAAGQSPTKFGFRPGQKITVKQAIEAAIVASANDAAVALAEQIAGNEDNFAQRMTETAHGLGMTRTVFRNATGLPNDGQVTTAHDMAVLAMSILRQFPKHYHFFSLRSVTIGSRTLPTVNGILGSYDGADGLKTGFTCGSGYNLVASAERRGRRLIGVVLGGSNRGERAALMTKLLNTGFGLDDTARPKLDEFAGKIASDEQGPPPVTLKSADCSAVASDDGRSTITSSSRLSGWGIVFGSFPKQDQAKQMIGKMQGKLKGAIMGGRPAIIQRTYEGTSRYSALLVGLKPEDASKACKQLWAEQAYCLALNPIVLNDPSALWR